MERWKLILVLSSSTALKSIFEKFRWCLLKTILLSKTTADFLQLENDLGILEEEVEILKQGQKPLLQIINLTITRKKTGLKFWMKTVHIIKKVKSIISRPRICMKLRLMPYIVKSI
jgi:hypothetical protein